MFSINRTSGDNQPIVAALVFIYPIFLLDIKIVAPIQMAVRLDFRVLLCVFQNRCIRPMQNPHSRIIKL